jgi:DNA repair ATPase RecN
MDGIDQVEDVVDTVSNVGDSVRDFTDAISGSGQDSTGDDIDADAPTQEIVADPDSEESVITIEPDNDNANDGDTILGDEELANQRFEVDEAAGEALDSTSELINQLGNVSEDVLENKDELLADLENLSQKLSAIRENPTSSDSLNSLQDCVEEVENIANTTQNLSDNIKNTVETLNNAVDTVSGTANEYLDGLTDLVNNWTD